MTCERSIGGEFELTPSDLALGQHETQLPRFGRSVSTTCDTGRSALRLALRNWLAHGGNGRIWLPEYICESVPTACRAEGCRIEYFEDSPCAAALTGFPRPVRGDAVLLVHYFGFVNRRLMKWMEGFGPHRDWTLIEDCVQAAYTDGVGRSGDYAIVSLRKWWALPDGAGVVSDRPLVADLAEPDEAFVGMRTAAKLLRAEGRPAEAFLPLIDASEALLNGPPRKMSWLSARFLSRCDPLAMAGVRRSNWQRLAAAMASEPLPTGGMTPLFATLGDGDVPLSFPIRVAGGRRDTLRSWLGGQRIYCPVHWSIQAAPGISAQALDLSVEQLSLPIDQRYSGRDMDRIAAALVAFFRQA